jgi:hypothetical protein
MDSSWQVAIAGGAGSGDNALAGGPAFWQRVRSQRGEGESHGQAHRGSLFLASATLLSPAGSALAGGKEIFLSRGCNTCHSVPTGNIKGLLPDEKAPDLVNLAERYTARVLRV